MDIPPRHCKARGCNYFGTDFGTDMSREDGVNRACRPCNRRLAKLAGARKVALAKAWHQSPEFVPGTVAPDSWRVANGYPPRQGRPPSPTEVGAALGDWLTGVGPRPSFVPAPEDEIMQAEYDRMMYGDPNAVRPRNPNLTPD